MSRSKVRWFGSSTYLLKANRSFETPFTFKFGTSKRTGSFRFHYSPVSQGEPTSSSVTNKDLERTSNQGVLSDSWSH